MAEQGCQRVSVQVEQATRGARIDIQGQHRNQRQRDSGACDAEIQILELGQIHATINICERISRSNRGDTDAYDFDRARGTPSATINSGLLLLACGSKNFVVSSS